MSCSVQDDAKTAVKFSLNFFPYCTIPQNDPVRKQKALEFLVCMSNNCDESCEVSPGNIVKEPLITDQTHLTATLISVLVDSALKG